MFKKVMLAVVLVVTSQWVFAQDAYSIRSYNPEIDKINIANGSTISSVAMTDGGLEIDKATAIDKDPTNGDLYVIYEESSGGGGAQAIAIKPHKSSGGTIQGGALRLLGIVDPESGVITQIGVTGDSFSDIAFKPDGTLYGIVGTGGSDEGGLYSIDLSDGTTTLLANLPIPVDEGHALTFNSNMNLFYYSDDEDFYSVDPVTFAATLIVNPVGDEITGIHYDSGTDVMYMTSFEDLYEIDTAGSATMLGSFDGGESSKGVVIAAPAVVYQVPSLSIFGLMALALGLVLLVRKESNA